MTIPPPRAHQPGTRRAEQPPAEAGDPEAPRPSGWRGPGPITTSYLCLMATVILLAILLDWRI